MVKIVTHDSCLTENARPFIMSFVSHCRKSAVRYYQLEKCPFSLCQIWKGKRLIHVLEILSVNLRIKLLSGVRVQGQARILGRQQTVKQNHTDDISDSLKATPENKYSGI